MLLLVDAQQPASSCMNNPSTSDEDVDRSEDWVHQVASGDLEKSDHAVVPTPLLQLAASRHQLANIVNTDTLAVAAAALVGRATAASKSSLAFILGGSADEDQAQLTAGPSFGTLRWSLETKAYRRGDLRVFARTDRWLPWS